MKGTVAIAVLVVLAMAELMARPSQAITCGEVDSSFVPCVNYLENGGTPSTQCCTQLKALNDKTQAKADRQAACECLKKAAASHPNIKQDAASDLPKKCGIQANVPISPTVDCSSLG